MTRMPRNVSALPQWLSASMRRLLGRIVVSVRWLCAREQLPPPQNEERHTWGRARRLLGWMLAPEDLGDAPPVGAHVPRRGFASRVLSPERLPEASYDPRHRRARTQGFLPWLFGVEELPARESGVGGSGSPGGFLRRILAPDSCPTRDTTAPYRTGRGFARGLVTPESCPEAPVKTRGPRRGLAYRLLSTELCPKLLWSNSERRVGFLRSLLSPEVCPRRRDGASRKPRRFLRWLFSSGGP